MVESYFVCLGLCGTSYLVCRAYKSNCILVVITTVQGLVLLGGACVKMFIVTILQLWLDSCI